MSLIRSAFWFTVLSLVVSPHLGVAPAKPAGRTANVAALGHLQQVVKECDGFALLCGSGTRWFDALQEDALARLNGVKNELAGQRAVSGETRKDNVM